MKVVHHYTIEMFTAREISDRERDKIMEVLELQFPCKAQGTFTSHDEADATFLELEHLLEKP